MKFVIALCLVSFVAHADCMESSWKFTPANGTTLPANGRITLDGYGGAQKIVATMKTRHPRLVAGSVEVPLSVVELHVGEFDVTQVVLKPETTLKEGMKFTLRFDDAPSEVAEWTVTQSDTTAPVWTSAPIAKKGLYKEFGCGPAIQAIVGIPATGAIQVRARANKREFLIDIKDGAATVGHSMCWGPFRLKGEWSLELSALDAAGNETRAPGAPLRFKGVDAAP